ncbi:MAG: hypothetical protein OHK0031_13170 [Anaerolineales bacterium]
MKLRWIQVTVLLALTLQACNPLQSAARAIRDERPNFLLIITDDQRYDSMQYMPETQARIFDQGVTFKYGYITTPLCCPSRSSILTGEYAHNTGVRENGDKLTKRTFPEDFHENGYSTALVGKYLNSWKGEPRPEFDFWVSYFKGEVRYDDPPLNVNGKWSKHSGYVSDILGDYAVQYIQQAAPQNKPFLLIFAPNAPHEPSTPYAGDLNLFPDMQPYRPPSYNEADTSDKPDWFQNRAPLTEAEMAELDQARRDQILTLVSLDRAIGRILQALQDSGEMDKTVIIFLSDNGKFWGEHRITSKNSFYEEATHVPFAMRYPPLVPTPYVDEKNIVANIDIAPTFYQLAEIPIPASVDGWPLTKLLNGGPWRQDLLIEGWPPRGEYAALRTGCYVYAETNGDRAELYNLDLDPYQLTNIADDPANQTLVADLKKRLDAIRGPLPTPPPAP